MTTPTTTTTATATHKCCELGQGEALINAFSGRWRTRRMRNAEEKAT